MIESELAIQAKCLQRSVTKMWNICKLWAGDSNWHFYSTQKRKTKRQRKWRKKEERKGKEVEVETEEEEEEEKKKKERKKENGGNRQLSSA